MAWRIDEFVVRGEIDNRERGHLRGRIWFAGRADPVVLDLQGNCWRDLAGRRLEFTNPNPTQGMPEGMHGLQDGAVGDVTASRKVKVPEVSVEELMRLCKQRKPFPWHWGNSLYLEWYSQRNGRVVIESATYEMRVVGLPAWEMTEAEEQEQRKANGRAMAGFMERVATAVEAGQEQKRRPDNGNDSENRPMSEEEAEAMQTRSDLLLDRIQARMEKEGDGADFTRILEEELERLRRERGEPEATPEEVAHSDEWIAELNRAAAETMHDPELRKELNRKHPLAQQAYELVVRVSREVEERRWLPDGAGEEHPVADLVGTMMKAGAKLAGALNGWEWPPEVELCAGTTIRLKRALAYLEDAARALEACREEGLLPSDRLDGLVREIRTLAVETDALIRELRERLERGFD